ncbi:uncharacterized protein LOC129976056 [Argiope bruennichi]|uniref:uncharacterized protein LOC129976056 n=1 Tax=Argiope bruennichi TaxID=94029 RepID=UPI002494A7BF|nr:uncharacterized protein LOC129976056 [Argiope bruennichi]
MSSKPNQENWRKNQARSISSEDLWTKKNGVATDPFPTTAEKSASLSSIHRDHSSRSNTIIKPMEISFLSQPITGVSESKNYTPSTALTINSSIIKPSSSFATNTASSQVANHPTTTTFCASNLPVANRAIPVAVITSIPSSAYAMSKIATLPSARTLTPSSIADFTSQTIKSSSNPTSRNSISPDTGSFASSIVERAPASVKRTSSWPSRKTYDSPTKRMHASTAKSEFKFPIKYPICILAGASLGEAKSDSNAPSSQHGLLHPKVINFRHMSGNTGEQTAFGEYNHHPTDRTGNILQDASVSNTIGDSFPTTGKAVTDTDSFSVEAYRDSDSPRFHRKLSSSLVNISPEPAVADTEDLSGAYAKESNPIHENQPHIIRKRLFPPTENVGESVTQYSYENSNRPTDSIPFQHSNFTPSFPSNHKTYQEPKTYYGDTASGFSIDGILDCSTSSSFKLKTDYQTEAKMPSSHSSSNLADNYNQRTEDLVNTDVNVIQTSVDIAIKNSFQRSECSPYAFVSEEDPDNAIFANKATNILRFLPRHISNECKDYILQFLDQVLQYSEKNGLLEN